MMKKQMQDDQSPSGWVSVIARVLTSFSWPCLISYAEERV
jgi:hypothetical protein